MPAVTPVVTCSHISSTSAIFAVAQLLIPRWGINPTDEYTPRGYI